MAGWSRREEIWALVGATVLSVAFIVAILARHETASGWIAAVALFVFLSYAAWIAFRWRPGGRSHTYLRWCDIICC